MADGATSYVIDTEVVAYDRDTGNLLPFQVLRQYYGNGIIPMLFSSLVYKGIIIVHTGKSSYSKVLLKIVKQGYRAMFALLKTLQQLQLICNNKNYQIIGNYVIR